MYLFYLLISGWNIFVHDYASTASKGHLLFRVKFKDFKVVLMKSQNELETIEEGGEADSYPTLNVGETLEIEIRCLKSAMQVYIQDEFSFSTTKLHPGGSPPRIRKIQLRRAAHNNQYLKHLEMITMTIRHGNFKTQHYEYGISRGYVTS